VVNTSCNNLWTLPQQPKPASNSPWALPAISPVSLWQQQDKHQEAYDL